ncbi:MAG: ribonuclease HI [Clostridia bacterium]|nr:ribonuclease HI [Clostridia bacterium]
MEFEKNVIIYTDGACSGNPGPGGYAAILIYNGIEKEISGGEISTTNNRMELLAVLKSLEMLKESCNVTIYSDSAYVVNAIEKGWLISWKNHNWIKSDKKEVKNIELWEEMLKFMKIHNITFVKVKGHSNNEYNNRCDKLAVTARENIIK